MNEALHTERWRILSDWHNTWLAAPAAERPRLRAVFASEHPDLLQLADDLAASSDAVDGFLETPALALAARDLAQDEPPLPEGTVIGPYRIVSLLARGGMGDVYRATDPRLGRDVALKTLPKAGPTDAPAVERFLQEARLTASLDHPNIVKVFDVGMSNGRPYLVSELLEGETLRAPILKGPLAPADVRGIAAALASGLVAAHARGLVHRDLKPENIFVTRSGTTKILDFGIAKLAQDPALPRGLATLTGVILGTAGYLAPEQVMGEPVDARTDLFALGSILFELMTGQRAFAREHTIDALHAIVHDEPPDLLPHGTALTAIVRRLLAKAPDARFQSASDLLWALQQLDSATSAQSQMAPVARSARFPSTTRRWVITGVVSGAMAMAALLGWWLRDRAQIPSVSAGLTQFPWSLPAGIGLDSPPIVSPDGRRVAFTAVSRGTAPRLFVRFLDSLDATAIAGTDWAKQPFWSPDGTSLGYFALGKLMKVAVAGGVPVEICDAPDGRGGTWSSTGTIVFSPNLIFQGLSKVSANGGPVEPATLVDLDRGENSHRWPVFLPDGVHVLFHVRATDDERRGVYLARVDRPASKPDAPLFRSESDAVFVPTSSRERGVLLSAADGRLQAWPFDAAVRRLVGDPRTLPVAVGANTPYHPVMLSASAGLLASAAEIPYGVQLGSVARDGTDVHLSSRRPQNWPRLSPDGLRLAQNVIDPARGNPDIWVENLQDGSRVRVTTDIGNEVLPVWSPDGRRLAFGSGRGVDQRRLSIAATDGTGVIQELPCPAAHPYCEPTDWSPDGRSLIVNTREAMSGARGDVWRVPVEVGGAAEPILSGSFPEYDARISPDGRWLAYVSEETGRPEVSVRALSGAPRRLVVSAGGGSQPVWRGMGGELFYVGLDGRLRGRTVETQPHGELTLGPAVLLPVPLIGSGHWSTQYDVSRDGQRVYFIDRTPAARPSEITLVMGWRALLGL